MSTNSHNINDLHWLMSMLHSINIGLVAIDKEHRVRVWNEFMENHSGMRANIVMGKVIYELFREIPETWFKQKINSVITLQNNSFTTWEQRPYLFKFSNFHPITGAVEVMYQNVTFVPLASPDGKVNRVGIVVYDVTDTAISTMELEAANNELKKLSRTDRLTELNNRGYWEECLEHEFKRVRRTRQAASLIMFDIDHFKKVNDTYGHQAGDEVIRQTSAILKDTMRDTDIAGRYGGEEFGVILVDTTPKNAMIFAERLRKKIAAMQVVYDDMEICFTISLGIAEIGAQMETYKQWLEGSDQALYQSKENGRNQTNVYQV